jgi:hypothetical protein
VGGGGFNIGVSFTHTPYLGFLQNIYHQIFVNLEKKKKNCQKESLQYFLVIITFFSFFLSLAKFNDLAKKKFQNGY